MAIKRTVIIKSYDTNGNELAKSITSVNPAATNTQIDTFTRALNGLTTNTYRDAIRRDEESINEALAEEEG